MPSPTPNPTPTLRQEYGEMENVKIFMSEEFPEFVWLDMFLFKMVCIGGGRACICFVWLDMFLFKMVTP